MKQTTKFILVVDDDSTHRQTLCDFFTDEGFRCEGVEHGLQALAVLHSQSVDLVITDHQMPYLDGISLTRQITNHKYLNTIPVILLSGNLNRLIEEEGVLAGAFSVLAKPSPFQSLIAIVKQAIDRSDEAVK